MKNKNFKVKFSSLIIQERSGEIWDEEVVNWIFFASLSEDKEFYPENENNNLQMEGNKDEYH